MNEIKYVVVRNDEGQYSIWDSERTAPTGWEVLTSAAEKETCLEYIRTHWVDMTPNSLRQALTA